MITLEGWAFWLFVAYHTWYVSDILYFNKRRAEKYYKELRTKMSEGIIQDLKESDTTLVIDTSKGDHAIISRGPDAVQ